MGTKFLRKVTARACPIHMAVMDRVQDVLLENGYFSKDEVLEQLRFMAVSDSIRWDYIREFIQDELGIELVPIVSRFFKAYVRDASGNRIKTSVERRISPEKYLAQGNGKKTAGYCSVELDGGTLAIRRLGQKKSMANGVGKAYQNFANELTRKLQLEDGAIKAVGSDIN